MRRSVEYYSTCPSCAAANQGGDTCLYCGTSLIKKVTSGYGNSDLMDRELEYEDEDANLPHVKGKACTSDSFLTVFSLVFGGMFLAIPTVIFSTFVASGIFQPIMIGFFGIFWAVGIGSFIPLIMNIKNRMKVKNGRIISGIVRGYDRSSVSINDRPVLIMKVLIEEYPENKILLLNTGNTMRTHSLGATVRLRNVDNIYEILQ